MELLLVRHLWGVDWQSGGFAPLAEPFRRVGYRALEASPRHVDPRVIDEACQGHGFAWVAQVFSRMFQPGGTPREHLDSLREQIEECLPRQPLFFNAHSGSDAWDLAEAVDFFGGCLALEREYGITLSHETHRLRWMSLPWRTRDILRELPDLRITADFSHWVCVCERLLEDLDDIVDLAARRTHHLHARVGFPEGPQVPDPRVPAAAVPLAAHEAWWDRIWAAQRAAGSPISTLTPEFGPPPYQHVDPATGRPLADLTEICDWMARRQARRFGA